MASRDSLNTNVCNFCDVRWDFIVHQSPEDIVTRWRQQNRLRTVRTKTIITSCSNAFWTSSFFRLQSWLDLATFWWYNFFWSWKSSKNIKIICSNQNFISVQKPIITNYNSFCGKNDKLSRLESFNHAELVLSTLVLNVGRLYFFNRKAGIENNLWLNGMPNWWLLKTKEAKQKRCLP